LFIFAALPVPARDLKGRAESARVSCRGAYERAASAALVASVLVKGKPGEDASARFNLYSDISGQLDNTPYVSDEAFGLFCKASDLAAINSEASRLEALRVPAISTEDPADKVLFGLRGRLNLLLGNAPAGRK
jgi:hypothetical protein